jgi:hypothetical protein
MTLKRGRDQTRESSMRSLLRILVVALVPALLPMAACTWETDLIATGRALRGTAPIGSDLILVIDSSGAAFRAIPASDGLFKVSISSNRPVSVFVVDDDVARVLRVPSAPGALPDLTTLPEWRGVIALGQLQLSAGQSLQADNNPLDQIDTDGDGSSDLDDDDDDNDGVIDDDDPDSDGSGVDDDAEDLDNDDDGAADLVDDDDDSDDDSDDDGVDDDIDQDDDNDGSVD